MSRSKIYFLSGVLVLVAAAGGQSIPVNPPVPRDDAMRAATAAAIGSESPQAFPGEPGMVDQQHPVQRSGSLFARHAAMAASPQVMHDGPTRSQASFFTVKPSEPRKIRKNDLVTVIIREESSTNTKSTTDNKKSSDLDAILQAYLDIEQSAPKLTGNVPALPPELKFSMKRNFKGEGKFDRSDTVSARITALVLDVKPNGLLVLQAEKHIKQDEEEQHFVLTGTARAEDVTLDNTVLSTQLADLHLDKSTKGAVTDTSKRGFITRMFDKINPF